MSVDACDIPSSSVLDRQAIDSAWFWDSWRAPLSRPQASVTDIFFAVLGHQPLWMKRIIIARNDIARLFGLETATTTEIMNLEIRDSYRVGEKIGAWPIYTLIDTELVAGRNNKHLDFRFSVLKTGGSVVFSTVCTVHNVFGKIYLLCVTPFHTWGIRKLISNAVAMQRL